jgi:site-specific DNA-methyltransferase (adenine-specific)
MSGYMPKSKNDKWGTPKELYDKLNTEFKFNHDPCPITWKEGDPDGLTTEWGTSTFCNPPYSNTSKWIEKAYNESLKGKTVVMLINAITDTKAFHKYIYNKHEIRFIEGRLKFVDYTNPEKPITKAPNVKASMLVIFKNK